MAEEPSLQDIWRLLGRINQRLDALERQVVGVEERTATRIAEVEARLMQAISSLKSGIEARDFRLDEHGRRISQLEGDLHGGPGSSET